MKITKRQLQRIISESFPKYRLDNYERKKNQSLKQLMDSISRQIMFIEGQLMSGMFDYEDMFDWDFGHVAGLADTIDAAREKAAEEGVPFAEPDTSGIADYQHRGRPAVVSRWSMNENTGRAKKMKITKRQLRNIIKEEKQKLQEVQEGGMVGPIPSQDVYNSVHDEVLDLLGEFLDGYGVAAERGNFTAEDIRGLESLVMDAAREALETAIYSVGFERKYREH